MNQTWKMLIEKRKARLMPIYVLATVFLLFLSLAGFQYGGTFIYLPLAIICLSIVLYPTLIAWGIMLALSSAAVITYFIFTIYELIAKGTSSTIFSDGILVYLIYVGFICAIWLGIFASKPARIKQMQENAT